MKQLNAFIQARTAPSLPATPSQFAPDQIITLNDISALLDKQTSFWVRATLSITNFKQTFWYMSCPVCYKYTDVDYKEDFNCYCGADVVGTPRCRASLEVKDDSTSHPAIVFGETAELIFAQNAKYVMEKSLEGDFHPLRDSTMLNNGKMFDNYLKADHIDNDHKTAKRYLLSSILPSKQIHVNEEVPIASANKKISKGEEILLLKKKRSTFVKEDMTIPPANPNKMPKYIDDEDGFDTQSES